MMSLLGTGASCVYPLLAAKLNGWQFIATDADATNVDYATANVLRNNLTDKIKGKYFVWHPCDDLWYCCVCTMLDIIHIASR